MMSGDHYLSEEMVIGGRQKPNLTKGKDLFSFAKLEHMKCGGQGFRSSFRLIIFRTNRFCQDSGILFVQIFRKIVPKVSKYTYRV